jgi:hypothetical protein
VHPNDFTHVPSQINFVPSTIDIVLSNSLNIISNPFVLNDLSSDHLPVLYSLVNSFEPIKQKLIFNYSKANWFLYRKYIERNFGEIESQSLDSTEKIDKTLKLLSDLLQKAKIESVPKIKIRDSDFIISDEIKTIISLRNKYRRLWMKNHSTEIASIIRYLNKNIQKAILAFRNSKWNELLCSFEKTGCKNFWKILKHVKKKKNSNTYFEVR